MQSQRRRVRRVARVVPLVAVSLLLAAGGAGAGFTNRSFIGRTKSEACEGVRRDAHTLMGGPNLGGRLPSYCGDCAREVVKEGGKSVERWVCRVTVEIFN